MPHEDDAGQLRERLDHVEVAQRAHLEERHAIFLCVRPRLLCRNLTFEGQVESVPHKDPRQARGMLGKKKHHITNKPERLKSQRHLFKIVNLEESNI